METQMNGEGTGLISKLGCKLSGFVSLSLK